MNRNDYTFHVGYGLCRIIGNVTREVNGRMKKYVKLQEVFHEDTFIFVPADQIDDRTRTYTEPEIIHQYLETITTAPSHQESRYQARWKKITALLEKTDLEDRFDLLIYLHDGKIKNESEGRTLPIREKLIYDKALSQLSIEIALSLQIQQNEASELLDQALMIRTAQIEASRN